jgi:hypothetical protein
MAACGEAIRHESVIARYFQPQMTGFAISFAIFFVYSGRRKASFVGFDEASWTQLRMSFSADSSLR